MKLCICAFGHYDPFHILKEDALMYHTICGKPLECALSYVALPEEEVCIASKEVGMFLVCARHAPVAEEMTKKNCTSMETEAARRLMRMTDDLA